MPISVLVFGAILRAVHILLISEFCAFWLFMVT